MTQQEYKQKKMECWHHLAFNYHRLGDIPKASFDYIFDIAYNIGKQKETITQKEIEKAAEEYVLTRQQARHNAKREEDATLRDFDKTIKAWDAFDMEQAYEDGANFALGKQEKDADTVTIDKREYYKLCKYRRYVANWVSYFDVCPICGEYNQRGCICANCHNNKNWNNGE